MRAVVSNRTEDGFARLAGKPVADVAELLGVSKQRVHQLIEAERLDTIEITTASGIVAMTLVTDASLARYAPQPTGVGFAQTAHS